MRKKNTSLTGTVLLFLILTLNGLTARAEAPHQYSKEKPLTIVCDWDFPPYEFMSDKGMPTGYIIDVLNLIFENLNIPHTFVMKEIPKAVASFNAHEADLFIAPAPMFNDIDCYLSKCALSYFKVKAATRVDAQQLELNSETDGKQKLVMRRYDWAAKQLKMFPSETFEIHYHAPMEALAGIANGKYDHFIWAEMSLKWKIKELNLEGLRIDDLNLPATEIRIGGHNEKIILSIEDQFARLEQKGELVELYDKWFYPERQHDNTSPYVLYIAIAAILLLIVLLLIHQIVSHWVARLLKKSSEQTRLMNQALDMGGYMVAEYDPLNNKFKNIRGQLMDESIGLEQAMGTVHRDDFPAFEATVQELRSTDKSSSNILLRRKTEQTGDDNWQYLTGNCIKEHNEEGRHAYLLVAKDITKEQQEQQANDEMAAKYNKAFDVLLIAMSFYSKEGQLMVMNERMKEIIGMTPENQKWFYETCLFDAPLFQEVLYPGMGETIHACQHMYYPDINLNKYLEYRIRPVLTDDGEIRYYVITVRDITDERSLYLEQQTIERQLKVTNEEARKFEHQLDYLLSTNDMFLWSSNYKDSTIKVSRSLHKVDKIIPFDEYIQGLKPEDQQIAKNIFYNPLVRGQEINHIQYYLRSPITQSESWFAISGAPVYDKNGVVTGHFGIIRNITQLMRAQEELRQETAQAEQSGQLKATFLANMTHEIRTPLNAIVGFSDLLHMTENSEERKEYIHIIRHNCDLLLRLIDDILEASDMGNQPQSIEPTDTDFAVFFNETCQTAAQRVQTPGVNFLAENPYSTLPARVDTERIQQVITNFITNAVKYTKEGHIKLGYRQEERLANGTTAKGIYIYCEDTGAGIPKEKQASVFNRFVKLNDYVQGTGLGLSICKSIADLCGGMIGVDSEGDGKGSTFWLWIPQFLTSSK